MNLWGTIGPGDGRDKDSGGGQTWLEFRGREYLCRAWSATGGI